MNEDQQIYLDSNNKKWIILQNSISGFNIDLHLKCLDTNEEDILSYEDFVKEYKKEEE